MSGMFRSFYLELPEVRRAEFAQRAGTTTRYIETHLVAPASRRKIPNKPLMERLAAACAEFGAAFSKDELVAYFYESPPQANEAAA